MPLLINEKKQPLLFIHIPKTAGTSIKSLLRDDVTVSLNKEFKEELPCPPQHFHYALLKKLGITNITNNHIAVVRHPITRFISEYAYRKKVDPKFRYFSLTAFTFFAIKAYKFNPYLLSNHIRHQTDFIGVNTKLFRLEDGLERFFKENLTHLKNPNTTSTRKNISNSREQSIDPRTLRELEDFYKKDINTLGYSILEEHIERETLIKHLYSKLLGNIFYLAYRVQKKIKP